MNLPVAYHGSGRAVLKLTLANLGLTALTLGLYRFWGVTRLRAYLWSHTVLDGDPLEYAGNGAELLKGAVLALVLILLPLLGLSFAANLLEVDGSEGLAGWIHTAVFGLYVALVPFATYRAKRYHLGRTCWRGIRGRLGGSAVYYTVGWLLWTALAVVSAGFLLPVRRAWMVRYIVNHAAFGNLRFRYHGSVLSFYRFFLLNWVLGVASLGAGLAVVVTLADNETIGPVAAVVMGWGCAVAPALFFYVRYRAQELRYIAGQVSLGPLRLSLAARAPLTRALAGATLIRIFSLGLARHWEAHRVWRASLAHGRVAGTMEAASLRQASADTGGLGLGEMFASAGI